MRQTKTALSMPKRKTRTQIICDNLGLSNQTIFQDYKCTLKTNLSHFGRLYIGEEHLMFVSNMFGRVKKTAIVIDSITRATQPTEDSIAISAKRHKSLVEEDFTFSGFKNNIPFTIITALWKKETLSSQVLNSHPQEDSEEKMSSSRDLDDANIEISLFDTEAVEAEKQKMLQVVLPCSVEQFYNFFLADDANVYSRKQHFDFKKARNFVISPWKMSEEMGAEVRELSAMIKVSGVPFKSEAPVSQVHMLIKHTEQEIRMKIITQMADIPYSSYFNCEEHISVDKEGDNQCKYLISTAIVFNKATSFKNTILTRTYSDLSGDYKLWSDNVRSILEKMQRESKQEKSSQLGRKNSGNEQNIDVQYEVHKFESEKDIANKAQQTQLTNLRSDIRSLNRKVDGLIVLVALLLILVVGGVLLEVYQLKHGTESLKELFNKSPLQAATKIEGSL